MEKSEIVKRNLKKLAKMVDMRTPNGWGFCLMIFPFHTSTEAQYVCNAQRADMIRVLRQYADHLEKHKDETNSV